MSISRNIKASSVLLGLLLNGRCIGQAAGAATRVQYRQIHMGVQVRMAVYAADRQAADAACRAAYGRIAELDDALSDYRPTSELRQLCARAGGPPVKVSEDLFAVLSRANDLAERSGGAFDATVGPYVQLWRTARQTGKLPSDEEWRAAGKLVGWRQMRLDSEARTVELLQPGMKLDLGAIAKGYALDQALRALREHGVTQALIEAGGDIAVGDPPPGRKGWRVRVWQAAKGKRRLIVANCGVSTSGDTEQYVEIDGKCYSHIIDPRHGLRPGEPILATVVAPDATTSDSLATACVVLGEEEGRRLCAGVSGATLYTRRVAKLRRE